MNEENACVSASEVRTYMPDALPFSKHEHAPGIVGVCRACGADVCGPYCPHDCKPD